MYAGGPTEGSGTACVSESLEDRLAAMTGRRLASSGATVEVPVVLLASKCRTGESILILRGGRTSLTPAVPVGSVATPLEVDVDELACRASFSPFATSASSSSPSSPVCVILASEEMSLPTLPIGTESKPSRVVGLDSSISRIPSETFSSARLPSCLELLLADIAVGSASELRVLVSRSGCSSTTSIVAAVSSPDFRLKSFAISLRRRRRLPFGAGVHRLPILAFFLGVAIPCLSSNSTDPRP